MIKRIKRYLFAFLFSVIAVTCFAQRDTTEWTILLGGKTSGFLKKWKNADGSFSEWFQFNDRGRGDSTRATYRYDEAGYFSMIDGSGKDYYKKPVFEKLTIENGVAKWENNTEKDQRQLNKKVQYVPLHIIPGTSFDSYFKASNNTIQLLPTGSSTLSVVKDHTIAGGGKVRLIATTGNDFTPTFSWIDDRNELFATVSGWAAVIKKGSESEVTKLLEIQDEQKMIFFQALINKLRNNLTNGLVITNATLFDPKTGKTTIDNNIVVHEGRIKEIVQGKIKFSQGYKIIDAAGKFVMPGLWDMHVHYGEPSSGLLHLARGVTNVRDMGNDTSLIEKKKEIDAGNLIGPRIQVMCGFIDGDGPYTGPAGERITSVEQGKVAVKKYFDLGYKQIKLYSSIDPTWVKPLADEAHRYGMRVSGHIPAHMLAEEAVTAGYDEIQHINMLFLNFYGKDLDTRTPARFTTVAQKGGQFDFNAEAFKHFVDQLKEKKTVIDPTVTVFESMFTGSSGTPSPPFESVASRLPLNLQRQLKKGPDLDVPEGMKVGYEKSFRNMLKMVKILYDNGITIVPGTDGLEGFQLHRELINYANAGIPAAEVLKIATYQSAQVAGKAESFGTIEKGRPADLIIIDGNPLKNIHDIEKVEIVIKDNDMYYTKDIDTALSIVPFK